MTDSKGKAVAVTQGADGKYTFTMPASKVTVEAVFQKLASLADPVETGVADWLITDDHIAYLQGRYNEVTDETLLVPTGTITRAEVAVIFHRLLKNKNVEITKTFSDVDDGIWYADAVRTLASLGIINGRGLNNFDPRANITRAEFAAIATRFAKAAEGKINFPDVPESFWAYRNIATAAAYGWIEGYDNGRFGPQDNITRAEAATIVNHMLLRAADRDYERAHRDELKRFSDFQDDTVWYYYEMVEAINAHDFTRESGAEKWKVK